MLIGAGIGIKRASNVCVCAIACSCDCTPSLTHSEREGGREGGREGEERGCRYVSDEDLSIQLRALFRVNSLCPSQAHACTHVLHTQSNEPSKVRNLAVSAIVEIYPCENT